MTALCARRQGSGLDRGGGVNGVPAAARRRELYGPRRSRPGLCGHGPGMFLLLRPVSYHRDGGGGALPRADGAAALVPTPLLLCADHASLYRGETAWEASCSGWRRVRVCLVASSGAPKVEVGIGRNPCWLGRHRCGGACGYRLTFLEGVGATLPLSSQRTGGNPWQQRRHRRVPSWRC